MPVESQPLIPAPEWAKVPPVYSNFFVITATPTILRIAFGEGFGPEQHAVYHAAVALNPQDAATLAKSILDTLEKQQQAQGHASKPEERKGGAA